MEDEIQNQGYLPTNVTEQAIANGTAKTVKAGITLVGADLMMGDGEADLGHLPGNRSLPVTVEWLVRTDGSTTPTAVIRAVSEKGGTHSRKLSLQP